MGPNVVCSLVGDGSQPIQLCLGIGVGNPRETVDAENNFSKASCQASFFFFFISRLHSSVPYPRTAGSRRENVGTMRSWIEEPALFSLFLSLFPFFSLFTTNLSLKREYRIILANFRLLPNLSHLFPRVSSLFLSPFFRVCSTFSKRWWNKALSDFHGDISFEGIKLC